MKITGSQWFRFLIFVFALEEINESIQFVHTGCSRDRNVKMTSSAKIKTCSLADQYLTDYVSGFCLCFKIEYVGTSDPSVVSHVGR